jgi:hypothetical protein
MTDPILAEAAKGGVKVVEGRGFITTARTYGCVPAACEGGPDAP